MAFHFDAQADSSDDEAAMDLSAWKSGAKRVAPVGGGRAPVAPMMGGSAQQEEMERSITPSLSNFQNGGKGKRAASASASRSPAPLAFQPINDLDQESSDGEQELEIQSISSGEPAEEAEEQDQDEDDEQYPAGPRKLVVRISRTEGDDRDEYEDYTTGSDRVRQLLWEVRPINRQVAYQVLFEDFHDEAVCISLPCPFMIHSPTSARKLYNQHT